MQQHDDGDVAGLRQNTRPYQGHLQRHITLSDISLEAYDYVVNGKNGLLLFRWVMERQGVTTDKASGIVNDVNNYAIERMQNPAYPLEHLQRSITVSIETP